MGIQFFFCHGTKLLFHPGGLSKIGFLACGRYEKVVFGRQTREKHFFVPPRAARKNSVKLRRWARKKNIEIFVRYERETLPLIIKKSAMINTTSVVTIIGISSDRDKGIGTSGLGSKRDKGFGTSGMEDRQGQRHWHQRHGQRHGQTDRDKGIGTSGRGSDSTRVLAPAAWAYNFFFGNGRKNWVQKQLFRTCAQAKKPIFDNPLGRKNAFVPWSLSFEATSTSGQSKKKRAPLFFF